MVVVKTTRGKIVLTIVSILAFILLSYTTYLNASTEATRTGALIYGLMAIVGLIFLGLVILYKKSKPFLFLIALILIALTTSLFYAINASTDALKASSLLYSYILTGLLFILFMGGLLFKQK